MPVKPKRTPGRPRDPKLRDAILRAALQILEDGGIAAVTMEAVAHRSGAGKPTIYRYWPNREALAMAALMASVEIPTEVNPTGSSIEDLRRHLRRVIDMFATSRGRQTVMMIASADQDSELSRAFRTQVMLASRGEGRTLLQRAKMTGDLRGDAEVEIVIDMIYGAIFYRLLIGHAEANQRFVNQLVDETIK